VGPHDLAVTDNQVPGAIDRRKAERDNIRIVDHREIFRGYEQLLPTFNSYAIECMLWRIEGLADRFLYFNDDMMLVGPVEPTDFFSNDGKVILRGRWNNWKEQPPEGGSASSAALSCWARRCWATHRSISLGAPT
jgi:Stealth protein CR2, conserved region 2